MRAAVNVASRTFSSSDASSASRRDWATSTIASSSIDASSSVIARTPRSIPLICSRSGVSGNSAAKRLSELKHHSYVEATGDTRSTANGCKAQVFVATDKARRDAGSLPVTAVT